jgi:hypothetical protein
LKRARNNLGLVYARTHRPDDALRQFTLAGLNHADARANLGFVYLTEKRFQEAKVELQLAATANPSSAKAQSILARFDKIESNAKGEQPQPVAASAPAAQPTIHSQFEVVTPRVAQMLPAIEAPRPVAQTAALSPEPTPRAAEPPPIAKAATPSPAVAETPRRAPTEAPRYVALASKTTDAIPPDQPTEKRDLPTQQVAPVLSDYQF